MTLAALSTLSVAAFADPAPLESYVIPAELDGRTGTNRAKDGIAQIAAATDVDAIKAWLARYADSRPTVDSYRKEAERLLLWSTLELGKPLSSLTHEDVMRYRYFLTDPQPASRWVLAAGRKVARSHPDWRPFAGALSPASIRQAMVILNCLFAWLVNAGYLAGNPLSLSRQRQVRTPPMVSRHLEPELWQAVKQTIDAMPIAKEREQAHQVRTRWLFSLLYLTGMRISEVVSNSMGGFFCRRDAQGTERWWLQAIGKGDRIRLVPATDELMLELARYRRHLKMTALPVQGEDTPLLLPLFGKTPMSRGAVHALVKEVFEQAARRMEQETDGSSKAQRLRLASAHWLRHTAASSMANGSIDLRHVRDNLGHASLSTTSIYLHSADDARHQETAEKHRMKWDKE